jgi:hypothetical protein
MSGEKQTLNGSTRHDGLKKEMLIFVTVSAIRAGNSVVSGVIVGAGVAVAVIVLWLLFFSAIVPPIIIVVAVVISGWKIF